MTTLSIDQVFTPNLGARPRPAQVAFHAPSAHAPLESNSASHQLMLALREVPLMSELSEPLLGLLSVRAQIRRYSRDDLIIRQDGVDTSLYVLRQGRAHVERSASNGRTVLLDVLDAGALVGEMSLIDGLPHTAGVRCVQPCEVLALRGAEVMHCQVQSPEFSQALTLALVRRLRERNRRIMSMSLDGVRERVLWQLQEWSEPAPGGQRMVSGRIGRSEIARMVGASREMVCRVLRSLQSAGRIELNGDRSIVLLEQPQR